jgi:hypothetical protein
MASFHHLKRQSDTGTPMDGPGEVSSGNLGAAGGASSDLGETITVKVRLNTGKEHSWSGGSNTQVRRRGQRGTFDLLSTMGAGLEEKEFGFRMEGRRFRRLKNVGGSVRLTGAIEHRQVAGRIYDGRVPMSKECAMIAFAN